MAGDRLGRRARDPKRAGRPASRRHLHPVEKGLAGRRYASEELDAMREAQAFPCPATTTAIASSPPSRRPPSRGGHAVIRFRIDDDAEIRWDDLVRGPMRWRGADLGGDMVVARRAPADQIGDPYNLVVVVDDAAKATAM